MIAQFGELHPKVLAAFDIKVPAAGFEIFLDAIPDAKSKGKTKPLFTPSPQAAEPLTGGAREAAGGKPHVGSGFRPRQPD